MYKVSPMGVHVCWTAAGELRRVSDALLLLLLNPAGRPMLATPRPRTITNACS